LLYNTISLELQALLGTLTLVLPSLVLWRTSKFYKLLIIYVATVFIFYSAIALKFPRYVLPALPAIYLVVAGLITSIQKNKIYFIIGLAILGIFSISNIIDTANKLILDQQINSVKHDVQQYVIDNSNPCSQVYSKTWYSFYYLRTRISDLPSNITDAVKSNCACPSEYVVSEGPLDQSLASQLQKEKVFTGESIQYALDKNGFRNYTTSLTPIEVYRISNYCSSQP